MTACFCALPMLGSVIVSLGLADVGALDGLEVVPRHRGALQVLELE